MSATQSSQARKRRRQAVVCTECRRRKIACDRSAPCAQCLQSNSVCTYYHSYSSSGDFSGSQDHHRHAGSSSDAAQPTYAIGQRPQLPTPSTANEGSTMATTASISIDTTAPAWFDTASLGVLPLPLSMATDSTCISFPSIPAAVLPELDTVVGMTDLAPGEMNSPQEPARVVFHKSRLYGPSHWMTLYRKVTDKLSGMLSGPLTDQTIRGEKYEQQGLFDDVNTAVFQGDGHPALQKCKRLARRLKTKTAPDAQLLLRPLRDFIPPKETADRLVQLYLRTFESVLRVLHVPTFQRDYAQYWSNPPAASESLVLQMLLVMAIGTCFYQDPSSPDGADGCATLHDQSTHWIHATHMRIATPLRKRHLNLGGVQTQCLLVLALLTNTNAVGGDLAWITTASLVQNAMAIGLQPCPC